MDTAGGSHQSYYNAAFQGSYSFRNPLNTPATIRFAFPLPSGSGTLQGFSMTVNGQPYSAADLSGGSVWEGSVDAGAAVTVAVTYRHQGSRGWSYDLSQRREPVKSFDLSIKADQNAKFERYSLFPTGIDRAAFGGPQTLHWQLQNAITAQNVAVVFEQGSLRETLAKVSYFAPISLMLGALLLLLWATLNRLPLPALRLALTLLGVGLGLGFGGILTGYLAPVPAELLGGALALGLGVLALGRRYLEPLLLMVLAPLTFLSVGNAGLLLGLLAVAALLLLLLRRGRNGLERRREPGSARSALRLRLEVGSREEGVGMTSRTVFRLMSPLPALTRKEARIACSIKLSWPLPFPLPTSYLAPSMYVRSHSRSRSSQPQPGKRRPVRISAIR